MIKNIILDLHGPIVRIERTFTIPFRHMCINLIMKHKNVSFKEAKKMFNSGYKKYHSSSKFMYSIGLYDEYLKNFDTVGYSTNRDRELYKLLCQLKRHGVNLFIASNNPRNYLLTQLQKIGMPSELFNKIVSANDARFRPYADQFKVIVGSSDKRSFLFLGDRPISDIQVARKFGIVAKLSRTPDETKQILKNILKKITNKHS